MAEAKKSDQYVREMVVDALIELAKTPGSTRYSRRVRFNATTVLLDMILTRRDVG